MVDTNHKIAFCIDSDGCAMDTMTYKHQLFFGPIAADIFGISEQERTSFLKEWDRVNLYSRTRGVNRFVGLVMGLEFAGVEHIDKLKEWVETTDSLSNNSLELALANDFSRDLEKALEWSNEVNHQIKNYEGDSLAFSGVLESLERLSQFGNVYVVSSANKEAVWQEWEEQGLLKYVDDIYCQDRGKKEDVIATLIASGYCRETILMVGDSWLQQNKMVLHFTQYLLVRKSNHGKFLEKILVKLLQKVNSNSKGKKNLLIPFGLI